MWPIAPGEQRPNRERQEGQLKEHDKALCPNVRNRPRTKKREPTYTTLMSPWKRIFRNSNTVRIDLYSRISLERRSSSPANRLGTRAAAPARKNSPSFSARVHVACSSSRPFYCVSPSRPIRPRQYSWLVPTPAATVLLRIPCTRSLKKRFTLIVRLVFLGTTSPLAGTIICCKHARRLGHEIHASDVNSPILSLRLCFASFLASRARTP